MTTNGPTLVTVRLGDRLHTVPANSTLADLLQLSGEASDSVATAVDGQFVPRAARAGFVLAEGQQVLLFHPIVGG
ncbi:sulfur carrier protein ThiS [Aquabacterium sp.]|uniref:sulfur carrier protein ThiS n=1 Tax=Aquabacterium sp. TaxID=1872578 RepID=UPI003784D07B